MLFPSEPELNDRGIALLASLTPDYAADNSAAQAELDRAERDRAEKAAELASLPVTAAYSRRQLAEALEKLDKRLAELRDSLAPAPAAVPSADALDAMEHFFAHDLRTYPAELFRPALLRWLPTFYVRDHQLVG